MILPVIECNRRGQLSLAGKIEHVLQSCEHLEGKSPTHEEINRNFGHFQRSLENLKRIRRPLHSEKPSEMIEEYVRERYRSTEIPVREIMTSTQTSLSLSFDGYENNDVFKDLSRQKRKFGKTWKDVYISPVFSECSKKDPIMKKSEQINKRKIQGRNRQEFLAKLIENYMGKKLGLIYKVNVEKERKEEKRFKSRRFVKKTDTQLKKIMTRARNSIIEYPPDYDEREYLAPELKAWTKDTGNKLKLEKIIIEQHQKERKLQMNGGLHELKLMKYDTISTKFINN